MDVLEFIELQKRSKELLEKVQMSQRAESIEIPQEDIEAFVTLGGVVIPEGEANPYQYARLEIHKREAQERHPEADFSKAKSLDEIKYIEAIEEKRLEAEK